MIYSWSYKVFEGTVVNRICQSFKRWVTINYVYTVPLGHFVSKVLEISRIRFGPDSKPNEKVWISFIEKLLLLHSTWFSFQNSILVQENYFKRIYLTCPDAVKGDIFNSQRKPLNLCPDIDAGDTLICRAENRVPVWRNNRPGREKRSGHTALPLFTSFDTFPTFLNYP